MFVSFLECGCTEEECYNSLATLVASNKDKVFVTQTKLLHEVTWKTVMHIARKHVVSFVVFYFCLLLIMFFRVIYEYMLEGSWYLMMLRLNCVGCVFSIWLISSWEICGYQKFLLILSRCLAYFIRMRLVCGDLVIW